MKRQTNTIRALMLGTACATFLACGDGVAGPDLKDHGGSHGAPEPSFLLGGSPLSLADPRPSPWGGEDGSGLTLDLDVSKGIFAEGIDRYAFRTTVTLRLGDGTMMSVDPKVDPAALIDPKDDPVAIVDPKNDPLAVTLMVPYSSSISAALSKELDAVRTDIVVELIDTKAGLVLDRVQASATIKY